MICGVLGDIHGDFDAVGRIQARHPEVPSWLSVGDVGGDEGHYEQPRGRIYSIKGNNEQFDFVAACLANVVEDGDGTGAGNCPMHDRLFFLPNGIAVTIGGLRVVGLGGTFAPTCFDLAASDLPHPVRRTAKATIEADRRRHFVREEVDACMRLRGIDVFLTHEAARPFRVGRLDAGKSAVNEVLAAMKPRLHFFGHHHRFSEQVRENVPSVGLDLVHRSYLLVDARSLKYEKRET